MGKLFRNKNTFLFLAIFFGLLAGLFVYFSNNREVNTDESPIQSIQKKVEKELYYLESAVQNLNEFVKNSKHLSFSDFQKFNTKYHFYIFNAKDQLVYWSDYRFVPDLKSLKGNYRFKYIENNFASYVVLKSKISHNNSVLYTYSFCPIQKKYKRQNPFLHSTFNKNIFADTTIKISINQSEQSKNVYASTKEFLFSIKSIENSHKAKEKTSFLYASIAFLFSFLMLSVFIYHIINTLTSKSRYGLAFFLLFIFLLAFRVLFLIFRIPQNIFSWEIFHNSKLYSFGWFYPTIGDFVINVVFCWVLLGFCLLNHSKTNFFIKLRDSKYKNLFASVIIFLVYQAIYQYLSTLHHIFFYADIHINISKSIRLDALTITYFFLFLLISSFLFFSLHILMRFFLKASDNLGKKGKLMTLLAGSLVFLMLALFIYQWVIFTLLIGILYTLTLGYTSLPNKLDNFRYVSTIYLFIGAILCAMLGTYALYDFGEKKDLEHKRTFANYLSEEKDAFAEPQLEDAVKEIEKDSLIRTSIVNDSISIELAESKIRESYLGSYFNRYHKNIYFFDKFGKSISPESKDLKYFEKKFKKIKYATESPNIYLINELGVNPLKNYYLFIEVTKNLRNYGYVVIDLKQEKQIPSNVYPILLVDNTPAIDQESKDYSYAIYDNQKIRYASGTYNYEKNFNTDLFKNAAIFLKKGVSKDGFHHLALRGTDTKIVVVTSKEMDWWDMFSNFSLIFVLEAFFITVFIIIYSLVKNLKGVKITFSTRIQIYMNLAFFIPLLVISITTLSITQQVNKQEFDDFFAEKTENIALNIVKPLEDYQEKKISKKQFENELVSLSHLVGVDVNIFDTTGSYFISNQPYVFEKDRLLSKYINPSAYASILEKKEKSTLLQESIGTLKFSSVYVPIKSYKTGDLMGVLSVPFFASQKDLSKKMLDILAIILNMFTVIFIVFLVFSYFASKVLTVPLRMITSQIKNTDFQNYSHQLNWESNDEIGLFVTEYNKMLKKLENSQDQLARTQKETAWREMAKQVAHEIKNPLTPMKLTLQHMQVRLNDQSERVQKLFERSFETLLMQVDTLDDIATSFSAFAKMPMPKTETFDIAKTFIDVEGLYKDYDRLTINTTIQEGVFKVRGDQKLMGRIFTNLIKNALEAMPEDRDPMIDLTLNMAGDGIVRLEVHDNGTGIPKNIQEKIFVPNFTTKGTGSGIGLSVAKRGIEHAGGRIWFETSDMNGTSFFIELPLVEDLS